MKGKELYMNTVKISNYFFSLLSLILITSLIGCGSGNDDNKVIDSTKPIITVTGVNPVTIIQNSIYADAGATAVDAVDGTVITVTSGTVDTATLGAYILTYTATDLAGNSSTATRTVNVIAPVLSGVAAAGGAIVGTVTVKGSLGLSVSTTIKADGHYNVDVTGLTPPYRIRAQGTVGGKTYKIYSYAQASDIGNTINVSPFTDLIIANTAQQIAESFFDSNTTTSLDPVELALQETALQVKLQAVFSTLGLDTAIDLLRTTFSTDHSGLDAALDLIQIGTAQNNIVTITNLLDGSTIVDDISDLGDNTEVIVIDPIEVEEAISDIQAIANLFQILSNAFIDGLPAPSVIEDIFSLDFIENDSSIDQFLTEITTDPTLVGLGFASVSISDLDSTAGTASVAFNIVLQEEVEREIETWFAVKDSVLGWQLQGDQRIVDVSDFQYICNDYDGQDDVIGVCGINTSLIDEDFTNNSINELAIASATVSLIDGSDGSTVKHIIYLGTPVTGTAGELNVYNEASGAYQGEWRAFGLAVGEINPAIILAGDIIEYRIYTENLDLSSPATPAVTVGSEVATYRDSVLYAPSSIGLYPNATTETITAIAEYQIGTDLTLEWILTEGTVSDAVLIDISDPQGNSIQIWDESFTASDTNVTLSAATFNEAVADNPNFDAATANYMVFIRIYAVDPLTGQVHSTDYRADVVSTALMCDHESGWDDNADGGLGAPINPNSFTDYLSVIGGCGGSLQFSSTEIAGKSLVKFDEILSFFDTGSATSSDPATGEISDNSAEPAIPFQWYVETIGDHTFLVIYTDSSIATDLPAGVSFRETNTLISLNGSQGVSGTTYHFVKYSEQSNYGDMVRNIGIDGEIWNSSEVLQ